MKMNKQTTAVTGKTVARRLAAWCGALGAALWLAGCAVTDGGRAPALAPGEPIRVPQIVSLT